jgi:hypothetical protein
MVGVPFTSITFTATALPCHVPRYVLRYGNTRQAGC